MPNPTPDEIDDAAGKEDKQGVIQSSLEETPVSDPAHCNDLDDEAESGSIADEEEAGQAMIGMRGPGSGRLG